MEGRRTVGLVLILCFVIGLLVGQSAAEVNYANTECYDKCQHYCTYVSRGNFRGTIGCMKCAEYCRRLITGEGKICILFWCWKVKIRWWKLFFPFWCWKVTTKNTGKDHAGNKNKSPPQNCRVMTLIKVNNYLIINLIMKSLSQLVQILVFKA